ncbi:MAG: hypothetical protein ACREQ3_15985 [Candidatus Binatia bacterium]
MNTQRRQTRCLTFVVIAAFFGFLTQPQIVTLHHDHPGGEHAHVHPQDPVSQAAQHSHDHHSFHHDHSHTTAAHHVHSQANGQHTHQTAPAYVSLDSTAGGHWHVFSALQLTSLTTASYLPRGAARPFLAQEKPFLLLLTLFTVFQPRAPPAFL